MLASSELAAELAKRSVTALLRDETIPDVATGAGQAGELPAILQRVPWSAPGRPFTRLAAAARRGSGRGTPGTLQLTVQEELDKLAGNIPPTSLGSNALASLHLGQPLTASILQDQAALYGKRMGMA